MVSLSPPGMDHALEWLGPYPQIGRLSLRHALARRRPGLWGDHPTRPCSVIWMCEGPDRREAFAGGAAAPALAWLGRQPGTLAMVAPDEWEWEIEEAFAEIEKASVITRRYRPIDLGPDRLPTRWRDHPPVSCATVRRLGAGDRAGFLAVAPSWGLRGWGRYETLLERGAAFGVGVGNQLASVAWTDATDGRYEGVGVATLPRYQRLGLGRAAAAALIRHLLVERATTPLWAASAENAASLGLATSLGLVASISETLLRCTLQVARS